MKKLCAGMIVQDKDSGKILIGHSTGKAWGKHSYDLPKGHVEPGEDPLDGAIRELKEEANIDIADKKNEIQDLGVYAYTAIKDLHLFYIELNIDKKDLKCTSTFTSEKDGKEYPEINWLGLIDPSSELDKLFKPLEAVVEVALQKI